MRRAIPLLAAALAAGSTAVALADVAVRSDPRETTTAAFDLRTARTSHGGRDVVVHQVTGYAATARLDRVRLEIDTGGSPAMEVYVRRAGTGAGIYDIRTNRRRAGATRVRHSPVSWSLRFSMQFAGLPERYRWRWRVIGPDNRTFDLLPNRGLVTHNLATGHD